MEAGNDVERANAKAAAALEKKMRRRAKVQKKKADIAVAKTAAKAILANPEGQNLPDAMTIEYVVRELVSAERTIDRKLFSARVKNQQDSIALLEASAADRKQKLAEYQALMEVHVPKRAAVTRRLIAKNQVKMADWRARMEESERQKDAPAVMDAVVDVNPQADFHRTPKKKKKKKKKKKNVEQQTPGAASSGVPTPRADIDPRAFLPDDDDDDDHDDDSSAESDNSDSEPLRDRDEMQQPVFTKTMDYEEFEPEAVTSDIGSRIRDVLSGRKRKAPSARPAANDNNADDDNDAVTGNDADTTDQAAVAPAAPQGAASFLSVPKFELERAEDKSTENTDTNTPNPKKRRKTALPWVALQRNSQGADAFRGRLPPMLQLHNEILYFVKLIDKTPTESDGRRRDVETMRALTKELFPSSNLEIFGSFANDLCIPNSDVDMSLFGAPKNAIFTLSRTLKSRGMVRTLETISTARVPIIKLHLKDSPFQIDICFDQSSGINTSVMIRKLIQEMPALRPLVLTVKYFLAQRDINETYRGGIGSHLCFCMIVSMLQHFRRRMISLKHSRDDRVEDLEDLGTLLLEFFDLYGRRFNYNKVGISLRNGGSYKNKHAQISNQPRPGILSLENPEDPSQDLGSSSYNMYRVRKAFAHAHRMLVAKLDEFHNGRSDNVLDGIIMTKPELTQRFKPDASEV